MNLEKLQELVGKAKFEEAAQSMAEEAANLMRWRGGGRSSDLPYELSAIIWLEPMALIKRIELIFDVYEQIPSYGLLAGIAAHWERLGKEEKKMIWHKFRELLAKNDEKFSRPIEYTLWCDFFEHPTRVTEAWLQMLMPPRSPQQVEKLLFVSGPVPYWLKKTLYEEVIGEVDYHDAIFTSLLGSRFDILGDIDEKDAGQILDRLKLEPKPTQFEMLRTALQD